MGLELWVEELSTLEGLKTLVKFKSLTSGVGHLTVGRFDIYPVLFNSSVQTYLTLGLKKYLLDKYLKGLESTYHKSDHFTYQ